ncbi:MAG: hypothetical protein WC421_09640 [Elusimicrobiales bacterium]
MPSKPVFNPEITRIKLNPEQAVLACSCYSNKITSSTPSKTVTYTVCRKNRKNNSYCNKHTSSSAASS